MEIIIIVWMIIVLLSLVPAIIALTYTINALSNSKNRYDRVIILLIICLISFIGLDIGKIINIFDNGSGIFMKIGKCSYNYFLILIMSVIINWYLIYLFQLEKLYTLPLIAGVIILIHLILKGDPIPLFVFIVIGFIPGIIQLINNGFKNQDGQSFSIGTAAIISILLVITLVIPDLPNVYILRINLPNLNILSSIIRSIIFIIFILGENGWLETHLLYDRQKKKFIMSLWLATRTT